MNSPRQRLGVALALAACWLAWRGPIHQLDLAEPWACPQPVLIDGAVACDGGPPGISLRAGDSYETRTGVRGRMAPRDLRALAVELDINRASERDLTSLRGVGPATAAKIVRARPFESVDALVRVDGIGTRKLDAIRHRLRVEP